MISDGIYQNSSCQHDTLSRGLSPVGSAMDSRIFGLCIRVCAEIVITFSDGAGKRRIPFNY